MPRPKKTSAKRPSSSKSRAKKPSGEKQRIEITIPATIGREHDTFRTLKNKAAMLEALKFTMAIVSPACDMVGIDRNTHYNWMKSDPGYANEVHNIEESRYDFVETKMLEKINRGSETMLIWYSKTKMKHRGFVERSEVEVTNKPAFVVKDDDKGIRKTMDVIHKKTGTK